jgi:hypothetical protein
MQQLTQRLGGSGRTPKKAPDAVPSSACTEDDDDSDDEHRWRGLEQQRVKAAALRRVQRKVGSDASDEVQLKVGNLEANPAKS